MLFFSADTTLYLDLNENYNKNSPQKRETRGYRTFSDKKMNKVLSDVTSSLSKFKSRKRTPKFDSESEDLSSLDSSDEEYDYSDKSNLDYDDDDDWSELSPQKSQRKTSRRKANKSKNKKSEKAEKYSMQESVKDLNPFHHFSELKDIQFKVNPDQEQDIATFIESLDTPPEIFSFDVEKYIKPEIELEGSSREFGVEEPQRQYYEFMETPNVDSMNVPLIPQTYLEADSNLKLLSKKGDSGSSPMNKRHGKRDLLRQYIKGISNELIGQSLPFATEDLRNSPAVESNDISAPVLDNSVAELSQAAQLKTNQNIEKDRETIASRTKALIENYAVNLDAMNYVKYGNHDKSSDDFIDNYYLLNDGSYKKNDESVGTHPSKYSSYDIQIDRDLERKFSDFNLQKNSGDPNTQTYPILKSYREEDNKANDQEHSKQTADI